MKANYWFPCLLLLALASAAFWWDSTNTTDKAPEVSFTSITGQKIVLKELRGKAVLVTFWATDCRNCIKEIPHLIDLYRQYNDKGLEIIAVSMYYDPPSHVVDMTQAQQLPYPVALDVKAELAHAFGDIQLTPSTFLIAPDGTIARQETGAFNFAEMKTQIEDLLKG